MKAIVNGPGVCGLRTLQRTAPTEDLLRQKVRALITEEFGIDAADDVMSSPTGRNSRDHKWLNGDAVMEAGSVRWRIRKS